MGKENQLSLDQFLNGHGLSLFLIAAFIFVGFYQIFLNKANFLVDVDAVTLFEYSHGNAIGNGWHPERGLGISFYYGDPGAFHAWSIFSLLEKIFPYPVIVYDTTILILLFFAAVALYYFLYTLCPRINKRSCALLALLIVLGPLQHEFYFQRHWITLAIGTPLLLLLLYRHLESPSIRDPLLVGLLYWSAFFLGSFAPFLQLLILGFLFFVFYVLIKKPGFWEVTLRYLTIHIWALLIVLLLGAWIFYPIFLEKHIERYVRDPKYFTGWGGLLNIEFLFVYIFEFLHCGLVSSQTALPVDVEPLTFSWINPGVVSPIIFIYVLCWKPKDFWPITIKKLYLLFLINDCLSNISPFYSSFIARVSSGAYPLEKFQLVFHPLAIYLMAVFIYQREKLGLCQERLIRLAGSALAVFYFCNFIFFIFLLGFSEKWMHLIQAILIKTGPHNSYSKFWLYIMNFFAQQIKINLHWYTFVFFALSAFLCWTFGQYRMLDNFGRRGILLPLLLAINGVLLSWSVYPTNKEDLVWSAGELAAFSNSVRSTDRFYSFASSERKPTDISAFDSRWPLEKDGRVANLNGVMQTPGLNLSANKSFSQKSVGDYLLYSMNGKISAVRDLVRGPEVISQVLDMAGVKFYYSNHKYNQPQHGLILIKNHPLWVYENTRAWPYYYLAKEIQAADSIQSAGDLHQGVAYVNKDDAFIVPHQTRSTVNIEKFAFGEMFFDYFGENENFLVIADAWHPFWRVQVDSKDADIIKSNFIFKGVRLPAGRHQVRFYFDTSAYRPGIYVSVMAWVLLVGGMVLFQVKTRRRHGVFSRDTSL